MKLAVSCRFVFLMCLFSALSSSGQTLLEARFARFVCPDYPRLAQMAKVHGSVVLDLTIDANGVPGTIHAVSGHPLLIPPAMEAANQWRFKPLLLNKAAVEFETRIQLRFVLDANPRRHRCEVERTPPETRHRRSNKIRIE